MTFYEHKMMEIVQHYSPKKYWKMRADVVSSNSKTLKLVRIWKLFRIKRMDAFNNASLGTRIGYGAKFNGIPLFPHGIMGIFICSQAVIGKNVCIYQQVTIGLDGKNNKGPIIGDNCIIGAGAKVIGNIKIGNNVKIGANCIVVEDVPDNSTVVMNKPRIILK